MGIRNYSSRYAKCTVSPYKHSIYTVHLQKRSSSPPFNAGCLPLSYSGNPGVTRRISQGGVAYPFNAGCLPLSYSGNPGVTQGGVAYPFDTGCLPLSYSGNPGGNVACLTGRGVLVSTPLPVSYAIHIQGVSHREGFVC